MREIVTTPTAKGDLSRELSARLDAPYLRFCRVCDATHTYEQPFRLSLLRAGLELEPGTSPPVLRRIPGWRGPAARVPAHLDPVRGGAAPARAGDAASRWRRTSTRPVREVGRTLAGGRRRRWRSTARQRSMLAADVDALTGADDVEGVRLLGPFDLFLQGRDRETVVPDEAARKDLWRTLGRPGGLLDGHEVVGTWRPRSSGKKLRLEVVVWSGARAAGRHRRGRRTPGRLPGPGVRTATWRG